PRRAPPLRACPPRAGASPLPPPAAAGAPPRPQAKAAIAKAKAAGIQVRMITGDHRITALAIARRLGIEGRAISGAEFGAMTDEQLLREIDGVGVIARVTPEHKVRLVAGLQRQGHNVRTNRAGGDEH